MVALILKFRVPLIPAPPQGQIAANTDGKPSRKQRYQRTKAAYANIFGDSEGHFTRLIVDFEISEIIPV